MFMVFYKHTCIKHKHTLYGMFGERVRIELKGD